MSANNRKRSYDLTKPEFQAPQSRLQANRWLDMAQFGAATARTDINASTKTNIVPLAGEVDDAVKLMGIGYEAYVDEQLADDSIFKPFSGFVDPGTGLYAPPATGFGQGNTNVPSYVWWFYHNALHSSCQIRLKTMWALSQIWAMRQVGGNTSSQVSYTRYIEDMLTATKSGGAHNYRWLAKQITMNWQMAQWLTYADNRRTIPGRQADENYGREVPQLFMIGLWCLNMDGTFMRDENGERIPTYLPEDIKNLAGATTGIQRASDAEFPSMQFMARFVDIPGGGNDPELGEITLFAYPGGAPVTIPARPNGSSFDHTRWDQPLGYAVSNVTANTFQVTLPQPHRITQANRTLFYSLNADLSNPLQARFNTTAGSVVVTVTRNAHGITNGTMIYNKHPCEIAVDMFLEHCFNHPSTPPFIAMSLIKHFVTSNPTPQFVRRVAEVFVDNGNGVRGDIAAVVKAILLDREAIIPLGINPRTHGKVYNPTDKLLKTVRAVRNDIVHFNYETNASLNNVLVKDRFFTKPRDQQDTFTAFGIAFHTNQMLFSQTPSVFNFYRPGYVPPSTTFGELGLKAPEMQVHNTEAATVWANIVHAAVDFPDMVSNSIGYATSGTAFEQLLDPRGQTIRIRGFDVAGSDWTVTAKTASTITLEGNTTLVTTNSTGRMARFIGVNRRTNRVMTDATATSFTIPSGTATKSVTVSSFPTTVTDDTNVGDVIFVPATFWMPHSGFPSHRFITSGAIPASTEQQPATTLFYRAASTLPDSPDNPTQAQIDGAIEYLESIFMSRPISASLRALMSQAATLPITLPNRYPGMDVSDSASLNHYRFFYYSHNQVRIRRMIGLLLLAPEYSVQH